MEDIDDRLIRQEEDLQENKHKIEDEVEADRDNLPDNN